jgi:hypothetical protein
MSKSEVLMNWGHRSDTTGTLVDKNTFVLPT